MSFVCAAHRRSLLLPSGEAGRHRRGCQMIRCCLVCLIRLDVEVRNCGLPGNFSSTFKREGNRSSLSHSMTAWARSRSCEKDGPRLKARLSRKLIEFLQDDLTYSVCVILASVIRLT